MLLSALTGAGVDAKQVLAACGLSPSSFQDPNTRHDVASIARLWRCAANAAGDPAFGLRVSAYATRTSCHALGYTVFASSTLREALETIARYHRLVYDGCELTLSIGSTHTSLSMRLLPGYERGSDEQVDAGMSLLVRTCRALAGSAFAVDRVTLSRSQPTDPLPYTRFFAAPVSFGASNTIVFASSALSLGLREANHELARHNELAARRYLDHVSEASVSSRLGSVISSHLNPNISAAAIAKELGMSLRSLQRALTQEGTSYEAVLNEVRFQLAQDHLRNRRLAITEVAYAVGFEHVSTFNRAFKRWSGMTPSQFRHSAQVAGKIPA